MLKEIAKLMAHENCSDYTMDLLDFIKNSLLRMKPENRATCVDIVNKFAELKQNCDDSADYCVKRLKKGPKRSRTDSSFLIPVNVEIRPEDLTALKRGWHLSGTQDVEYTITATATERIPMETSSITSLDMFAAQPATSSHPPIPGGRGPSFQLEYLPTMPAVAGRRSESPLGMYRQTAMAPDETVPRAATHQHILRGPQRPYEAAQRDIPDGLPNSPRLGMLEEADETGSKSVENDCQPSRDGNGVDVRERPRSIKDAKTGTRFHRAGARVSGAWRQLRGRKGGRTD